MKRVLVIGATGAMGSSVVRELCRNEQVQPEKIRCFTRNPNSDAARQLAALDERIEWASGDSADEASIQAAMKNVDAVFCNTTFFPDGTVAAERRKGNIALEAARQAGVEHFVYASLDPATRLSAGQLSVPHYDGKAAVEADIDAQRSDEFMLQQKDGWYSHHVSVLVTCPYMENFFDFFVPQDGELSDGRTGKVFRGPLGAEQFWQMIALQDIGWFAAHLLSDRQTWGGRTLRIAGEEMAMPEIVRQFEALTGIAAEYAPMSEEEFLNSGLPNAHDPLNNMLIYREGFFERRDLAELRRIHPELLSFRKWLEKTEWRGEPRTMRKDAATG